VDAAIPSRRTPTATISARPRPCHSLPRLRRLEAKTQVFTRRYSDHFRNRLTHTIEVAQISRTIAAQLGLNTDLVEALALVHDLGHPPFGHSGEKALDTAMRQHGYRSITTCTRCGLSRTSNFVTRRFGD